MGYISDFKQNPPRSMLLETCAFLFAMWFTFKYFWLPLKVVLLLLFTIGYTLEFVNWLQRRKLKGRQIL